MGRDINLDSATGAIGAAATPLVLSANPTVLMNGGTQRGTVKLHAQGDIGIEQRGGDLRVDSIVSDSGNVNVNVTAGNIVSASGKTAAGVLSDEQIQATWTRLQLTQSRARHGARPEVAGIVREHGESVFRRVCAVVG